MGNRFDKNLIEQYMAVNSSDDKMDDIKNLTNTLCVGVVVDTDDPLEQGRLKVWCPDLNDNPKKVLHIPWASYVTPYGGSINNACYARGHIAGSELSEGSVHYGFWGIPEHGAHVIVACINGDSRRRVWLGCLPEQQETHTLFNGRFAWNAGNVDGPLTSSGSPIEPAYTNAGIAFEDDRESAEWKTRGAEYQVASVREDLGEIPSPSKSTYLDNQYPQMTEAEQDDWVKPKVGSHGYDWTGHKQLGEFKSSRAFGMTTPGFHSFVMDDRAFNSRIRIKTTAGHQILMDDTNERIYISTYEGESYVEMDRSGNIDIYSGRRISLHAEKDINIESDETVRIKGKKGIHMYAGDTTGQTPLDSVPADGQIRMHSTDDMHFYVENNLRIYVENDQYLEVGGNVENLVTGDWAGSAEGMFCIDSSEQILMNSSTSQMTLDGSGIESTATQMNMQADSDISLSTLTSVLSVNPTDILLQGASDVLMNSLSDVFSSSLTDFKAQFDDITGKFAQAMLEINNVQGLFSAAIDTLGGGLISVPTLTDIAGSILGNITGMIEIPNLNLDELIPDIIEDLIVEVPPSETEFAIWPNRVPEHEPWPRVMKQDSDDEINEENEGYLNNVDSIDQYDNVTDPEGREPIGQVEGDETIERNQFWRR